MAELKPFAFGIYRHDVYAGDGGCIAEERYRTIAEVLAHPYKASEEYWIHVQSLSRYMPKEEFGMWASAIHLKVAVSHDSQAVETLRIMHQRSAIQIPE